jgi:hypothetical protein
MHPQAMAIACHGTLRTDGAPAGYRRRAWLEREASA